MVTKESSRRRGRSREKEKVSQCLRSSSQKFKCYYYDKEGHMKRNCPKKKKDLRDEKPFVVGVAKDSHLADRGDVFLATTECPGKADWILDSNFSFCINSVREHFDLC